MDDYNKTDILNEDSYLIDSGILDQAIAKCKEEIEYRTNS